LPAIAEYKASDKFYRCKAINTTPTQTLGMRAYTRRKLTKLAGSWEMDDKEVEEIFGGLKDAWKNWKTHQNPLQANL
jgi:hypothetical protein